jgi:hypothetical protein
LYFPILQTQIPASSNMIDQNNDEAKESAPPVNTAVFARIRL